MMPEHVPSEDDKKKVSSFAAVGITQEDIARVLKIDPQTLRKHYREELDTAATLANASIGGKLFRKAQEGDTACLIWWTKSRMGWSEKKEDLHIHVEPITSITYVEEDASLHDEVDADASSPE